MRVIKRRIEKAILIFLILFSFFLFACDGSSFIGKFDDYDNLLKKFTGTKNETGNENPVEEPKEENDFPQIPGFKNILNYGFSYAQNFKSEYTFAVINSQKYFVSKDGAFIKTDDIPIDGIKYNKYIFSQNYKFGLKNIDGRIIFDAQFDEINYINETVLLLKDNEYSIYKDNKKISGNIKESAILINEDCILTQNGVCGLDNEPYFINGCRAYNYIDGMYFVLKDGNFGLIYENGETAVEPLYDTVESFINGYAVVKKGDDSLVLDESGKVIYKDAVNTAVSYDGDFLVYKKNDLFGICDKDFSAITSNEFISIQNNKVYFKDFLILNHSTAPLYSIKSKSYLYKGNSIIPCDNFFILKNDLTGKYLLLNDNAEIIAGDFDKIEYENGILMAEYNKKYYFYTL